MSFGTTDIDGMLNSYSEYLHHDHPQNAKRFGETRASDREAAVAEAVVFGILQQFNVDPQINDDVKTGGADFICCPSRGPLAKRLPGDRFVVEATSLSPDAVTRRSKLPNAPPHEIGGRAVGLLMRSICNKAKSKATQLGGYPTPRVLAIASSHARIAVLFDDATAEWALEPPSYWTEEIGGSTEDGTEYNDLETSVFMKPGPNGTIVACRQSISAILLVAVHGNQSEVWGILHPEPAFPLNIGFLPDVPFVRIARWPVVDGKLSTEWVGASPSGRSVCHFPVQLPSL